MIEIIGVQFKKAGRIYNFDAGDNDVKVGDKVIVETARGVEYGTVLKGKIKKDENEFKDPVKPIIRMATEDDAKKNAENKEKEKEAFSICKEKIREHGLEMKLINAEYTFDNKRLLFYFTADGRIDFRELVKDLASVFRTRIELRQVGVRDETKMLGGIGTCGRTLCCSSFLTDFAPVSIKMAKEQNLSLNPTKISGMCGRLMCCLKNEQEAYEELNAKLPAVGDTVKAHDGEEGVVRNINVLRQTVRVVIEKDDEREIKEYHISELKFKPKKRKVEVKDEEIKELAHLEEE